MFSTQQAAVACARAFDLFSRLYRHGLTPALWDQVEGLPALSAVLLPRPYHADEAAASFQTLFGLNVFPYQSLFLDPAGLLGGAETARVRDSYRQMGFAVDEDSEPADHLAHELAALAFLCQAEAEAREDGRADMVARARQLQASFLDEHLLAWLPAFTVAVQRQGDPFYAELAGLTLALAVERRHSLTENSQAQPTLPAGEGSTLPDLDAPHTDLDAIAGFLLTPVHSGLYLSRGDISRLGRAVGAPHGFGERRQMLRTFLRSAAEFDRFGPALAALQALVDETARTLGRCGEELGSQAVVKPWLARLRATEALFQKLTAALDGLQGPQGTATACPRK
jgi:TorA maturation chaperone TorD